MKLNLPNYLEEHAKMVPHLQTSFLLRLAAQELRKGSNYKMNSNFYIKQLPDGEFEVVYED